jgi:Mor family transcriptional regulator
VDVQVCFRLDFPAWLITLGRRNRSIVEDMALGHRTQDLARSYQLSAARVSQLRREFHENWRRFCGELDGE